MSDKLITLGKLRMNIKKIKASYQQLIKEKEEIEEKLSQTFFLLNSDEHYQQLGKKIIECSELIKKEKEMMDLYYELLEIKNV